MKCIQEGKSGDCIGPDKCKDPNCSVIKGYNEEPFSIGVYGWICPVCGRGLSPYTTECPCNIKREITC